MAKLQANGLQIEYDTFGDEKGDPMLLIMGLGTQMIAWSPEFCQALASQGHYVIRFDNRDIGLSTRFDGARIPGKLRYALHIVARLPLGAPYSLTDMAADALGVMDALNIESAHVVGASMGGMIAQLLTHGHPSRVKTLTSIMSSSGDPALPKARPELVRHMVTNRPKIADPEVLLEHAVQTAKMLCSPAFPRAEAEWRELIGAAFARSFNPPGYLRQMAAIIADGSRVTRLQSIRTPTLVMHGSDDPLVPVECGIDTARHIAGAELEVIEGMGHDLPPQLTGRLTSRIAAHAAAHASGVRD
jgi:pimeloyl-ACP methyl ester carboxylesterase